MSRGPDPQFKLQDDMDQRAADFFEPKLRDLKLAADQIQEFSITELEEALVRVDDAMRHPDQFGTLRLKISAQANMFVIPKATTEAQVEVGILPILLKRKALILDRIKVLRPVDQLEHLKRRL